MSNARVHISVGVAAGLVAYLTSETDEDFRSASGMAASSVVGGAFAKLPDLIEPATNPHHRQFFHSFLVAGALISGGKSLLDWKPATEGERLLRSILIAAIAGYGSHLLLDATTPMSLPVVGKI